MNWRSLQGQRRDIMPIVKLTSCKGKSLHIAVSGFSPRCGHGGG